MEGLNKMPHMNQLSNYATTVTSDDNYTNATCIVKFNHDEVILNSGGYRTVTTKRKMVQTANQFNLEYGVFQKDYDWFVTTEKGVFPFQDGIKINRNTGEVS